MPSSPETQAAAPEVAEHVAVPPTRRFIAPFNAVLVTATLIVAALSDIGPAADDPLLLATLVAMVLVLDLVRLDLFERVQISPASMPVLAAAALFGPFGPIVAEATIMLVRAARRTPLIKFTFDFGALSLAGAAAAVVFGVAGDSTEGLIAGGVLAGFAYYAVNASLLSVVIGLSRGTSPLANWREQLAWLMPHYLAYGALAGLFVIAERRLGLVTGVLYVIPLIVLWVAERQYVLRSRASVTELRQKNVDLEQANQRLRRLLGDNEQLLERIQRAYLATITSLARTIEAKDQYTAGHTERVAQMTRRVAEELGFDGPDLLEVELGAVIHDLGKIGVPDHILLKPGPLTDGEGSEMQRHPEISSYILDELDVPPIVKQMARNHHERYDGSGYPDGMAGEQIPLPARILTVTDALDAMTSDRPYRPARTLAEALEAIDDSVGRQFCPRVVAALHRVLDDDPSLADAPAQVGVVDRVA